MGMEKEKGKQKWQTKIEKYTIYNINIKYIIYKYLLNCANCLAFKYYEHIILFKLICSRGNTPFFGPMRGYTVFRFAE